MLEGNVCLSISLAASRGDLDNRIKTISDALNGEAYIDDRQIKELHVKEVPGKISTITVEEIV